MKNLLKNLSLSPFLKLVPKRDEVIEKASDEPAKEPKDFRANRIARALHPEVQHLKVTKVITENSNVKSFILEPDVSEGTKQLAYFLPGQYLSVTVQIGNGTYSRPYSIASSPDEAISFSQDKDIASSSNEAISFSQDKDRISPGYYMLSIARKKGGMVSNFILDNWEVGTRVLASAPLGEFVFEPLRDSSKVIAIAGGSGITPIRSMVKDFVNKKLKGDSIIDEITLIYGTKSPEDALYTEEFVHLSKECNSFKIVSVYDTELPSENILNSDSEENENRFYETGLVSSKVIDKYTPCDQYSVFVCGPSLMHGFISEEVPKLTAAPRSVRYEFNSIKEEDNVPVRQYEIILRRNPVDALNYPENEREISVKCHSNQTILSALEEYSLAGGSHCRSGICGWCRTKIISGEVYVCPDNDGRRIADYEYGYIHPCATFPRSDCVIER